MRQIIQNCIQTSNQKKIDTPLNIALRHVDWYILLRKLLRYMYWGELVTSLLPINYNINYKYAPELSTIFSRDFVKNKHTIDINISPN